MLRKSLYLIALISFPMLFQSVAEAATIRVSDAKVYIQIAPGGSRSGEIQVDNPTEDEVFVRVYAEDWSYVPSGNGEKVFYSAGTLPRSASSWVTYNPAEFMLQPFAKATLNYTLTAPAEGIAGTYHTVIFFETTLGEATNEEGANVLVSARLGSLFFVDAIGTVTRSGVMEDIRITPPKGNRPAEFVTTFKNTGNADIVVSGNVLILDDQGMVKGRGELSSIYTEEGMTSSAISSWVGRLDPGVYDLIFTFDLGEGSNIVEERSMTVE